MIVTLVAVTAIAITTTREDQPSVEEQVPAPVAPTVGMEQWELTVFPGAGVFIDLATGPSGAVAVTAAGTDWAARDRSSHVWSSDAESNRWRWVDIEGSPDAAISSVALRGDIIFAAGTLHADDITPTLWSGTHDAGLEIIDEPIPAPGYLHLIRDLDDQLVLVGEPFDPTLAPTDPIVLRGSPGAWTEITPEGAVEVHEVTATGSEWILVGMAEERRPAIWHSLDQGTTWTERPVMAELPATVTDVAQVGSEVFAMVSLNPATAPSSLLLRLEADSWQPMGEPATFTVHWLATIGGDLIAGPGPVSRGAPPVPYLWKHEGDGRWTTVAMRQPDGQLDSSTSFAAASDGLVVGTASGQPALWMPSGDDSPTISAPEGRKEWERVAVMPPRSIHGNVLPDGRMVAAIWPQGLLEAGEIQLLISDDGTDWRNLALPPDLEYGAVHLVGDQLVLVGTTDLSIVVGTVDEDEFVELAEVDGSQMVAVDTEDEELILYVRVADTTSRVVIPIDPDREVLTEALDWNPSFIHGFDDGLVVGGASETGVWPAESLQVSTDAGASWTELDGEPWAIFQFGSDVVVSTEPAQTPHLLSLDPLGLEPLEIPDEMAAVQDGWGLTGWAGGLAALDPTGRILLLPELGAELVEIELSPATGFDGILMFPSHGNHIVAAEGGERVVYRWIGEVP